MKQVLYAHIDWTSWIFQEMLCNLRKMKSIDEKVKIELMDTHKNQKMITMVIN